MFKMTLSAFCLHYLLLETFAGPTASANKENLQTHSIMMRTNGLLRGNTSNASRELKPKKSSTKSDDQHCLQYKYEVDVHDKFRGKLEIIGEYDSTTQQGLVLVSATENSESDKKIGSIKLDEEDSDLCMERDDTVALFFSACATARGNGETIFKDIIVELHGVGKMEFDLQEEEGAMECCDFHWNLVTHDVDVDCYDITPSPSSDPSGTPSSSPSQIPSRQPSTFPSSEPSLFPSASPTTVASSAPSQIPSLQPTSFPSPEPSLFPSASPSTAPSTVPTDMCEFDISVDCTAGYFDCSNLISNQRCEGRPLAMTLRYIGGNCSQSSNDQIDAGKSSCENFGDGNPTVSGELTFVRVQDLEGGILYFEGIVPVGELFHLSDGGERFDADIMIDFYDPATFAEDWENNIEEIAEDKNLLQQLQFHSSCSANLFTNDIFGSVQVVGWENEDQGEISSFVNVTLTPNLIGQTELEEIRLNSLLTEATEGGDSFLNNTEDLNGRIVGGCDGGACADTVRLSSGTEIEIDLSIKTTYNVLTTITGYTESNANKCSGSNFYQFTISDSTAEV